MIRDWKEHQLNMDFANIGVTCSDIDLVHVTSEGKLIIGEIKNAKGSFKARQKHLLAGIIDANKYGGAVLFIVHNKDVHEGDTIVDVSQCLVDEYYMNGEWRTPYKFITVKDAIQRLEEEKMGITIEGEGMVFAKQYDTWTSYTMGISSKTQDGKWVNAYVPIRFKKGESVENKTKINFRAFPTVKEQIIEGQNRNYIVWQILEYRKAGDDMAPEFTQYTPLQTTDIPF